MWGTRVDSGGGGGHGAWARLCYGGADGGGGAWAGLCLGMLVLGRAVLYGGGGLWGLSGAVFGGQRGVGPGLGYVWGAGGCGAWAGLCCWGYTGR